MQAVNNVRTQPNRSAICAQLETLVWLRASTPFVLLIAGLSDPIANYDSTLLPSSAPDKSFESLSGRWNFASFAIVAIIPSVWQWCEDWYRGTMNSASVLRKWPFLKEKAGERQCRAVRGGSWHSWDPDELLSSYRGGDTPDYRDDLNGFPCVLAWESSR